MKLILQRIVIYPVIVLASIAITWFLVFSSPPMQSMSPFGNIVSGYFYYINTSRDKYDLAVINQKKIKNLKDPELKSFYEKFDWTVKDHLIDYYPTYMFSTWNSVDPDGRIKPNFLRYWQELRPQVRAFYDQHLPQYATNYPIIHFRCSDSPFNKHYQYHMTKAASVTWMAQLVKERGFDKAIMLICNKHESLDNQSCAKYADFYADIFAKQGIAVEKQCNSILQDFSMMVYSPLLVTLNASSYSFMAGIAKAPQDYISCNMGVEFEGKYYLQQEADWLLDPNEPLLHKDVATYNDSAAVIKQLL